MRCLIAITVEFVIIPYTMSAVERFSPREKLYQEVPEGKSFIKDVLGQVVTLPPVSVLCNEIANTGKEMHDSEDETMQARSKPVLRIASHMFDRRLSQLVEQHPVEEDEVFDFTRVASLQEEIGDRKGAQITAKKVLKVILHNENHPAFVADEYYGPMMDVEKNLMLSHLDAGDPTSPNHPLHVEVFNSLSSDKAKKEAKETTDTIRAIRLIDQERADEGFEVAHTQELGIRFTLEFTNLLDTYIKEGETEKAKVLFARFMEHDFNRLEEHPDLLLFGNTMLNVLIGVGRDDILARMVKGSVRESDDGTRDTNNAEYFAMKAGAQIARKGRMDIESFQELLPEYLQGAAHEGFTIVRNDMKE